ncbi:ribosomal protein L13, partial [Blastocystis sp. subtype 4]
MHILQVLCSLAFFSSMMVSLMPFPLGRETMGSAPSPIT